VIARNDICCCALIRICSLGSHDEETPRYDISYLPMTTKAWRFRSTTGQSIVPGIFPAPQGSVLKLSLDARLFSLLVDRSERVEVEGDLKWCIYRRLVSSRAELRVDKVPVVVIRRR
jgi:hypothetical protein